MASPCNSFSLYLHIPFCARKCRYCDFYSRQYDRELADRFVEAAAAEWSLAASTYALAQATVETIFCGGGSPSVLAVDLWERLGRGLFSRMQKPATVEWSLECNPESFTLEKARAWLGVGVNRLTFGVQSLCERELSLLGRPHTAQQALEVLANPVCEEFSSVGVDLIYGLPGQTVASLRDSLWQVLSFEAVKHLSAYELTLSSHTPLGRHRSLLPLPGEDTVVEMMETIQSECRDHGLEQYEVSNYAVPGHECRHNVAYWTHAPYLGLGPAAHSYLPPKRFANVADTGRYIDLLGNGSLPLDFSEEVTAEQTASEMIFLGLRTVKGIDESVFAEKTGAPFVSPGRKPLIEELVRSGHLIYESPFWRPTVKGLILADAMARKLIM